MKMKTDEKTAAEQLARSVSIVIPALNEEGVIGNCIDALNSTDHSNLSFEIIVVDNGSTDATVEIALSKEVTVVVRKGVNISALRNYGASISKGDLLAFVDADCIVSQTWMLQALRCFKKESADAVGSHHAVPENSTWIGKTIELKQKGKTGSQINYIPSGNLIIKRHAFTSIKGFDETLITNEDVDLCQRLKISGFKLFSDPLIKSTHLGTPNTIKQVFFRELWHGTNTFTIFIRDLQKVRNIRIVSYSIVNTAILAGIILSVPCLPLGHPQFLYATASLFILLNAWISLRNWWPARRNFIGIFTYNLVYGLGRAASTLKWLIKNARSSSII
jgi:glycosyltransferase involved in cell wall biosynthesis